MTRRAASSPPNPARSHAAFARKYRPERFEEVVGQEAVGRTIRGALRAGRLPAALLFAGPRGVGKTTMARLVAKALNCASAEAATPDPCGACDPCRAVAAGTDLDVVEVDAASHNGVDDVREIRERVAHLPARGRFKVYILDEAHMFSTAAWNAFLKTLEEPPAHARFVFATTEPEKVPETILSRCQRFDFRRIPSKDVVRTLRSIVDRENAQRPGGDGIAVSDAALASLARFARGGLRDAESLLEQAVLAGDGEVREEDLAALLGAVPREMVRETLARAAAGDAAGTLAAFARVHDAGADAATFLGQALEMLREVASVAVAGPATALLDAEDSEREALAALATAFGTAGALRAIQALAETARLVRATDEERPLVEAGLLRVALAGEARTVPEILDALARIESRLGDVGPDEPREPGSPSNAGTPATAPPAPARRPRDLFGATPAASASHDETRVLALDDVRAAWPKVLDLAKARVVSLGTFLSVARPVLLADDALTLAFAPSMEFHRLQCEEAGRRKALEEALLEVLGRPLRAVFETSAVFESSAVFERSADEPAAAAAAGRGTETAAAASRDEERAGPVAAGDYDRMRHEDVERLRGAPVVKALEKEFKVRMVRLTRRGAPSAGVGEAGAGGGEAGGPGEEGA